ncbi:MAG: cytochrome c3 family protein [Deltaproteobacteria bacterium]|nr:cytochrome c3 family protein [Deltaproteobacteria bacterium]
MKASPTCKYLKVALLFSLLLIFGFAVTVAVSDAESVTSTKANIMVAAAAQTAPAPAKKSEKAEAPKIDPTDPSSVIYLDTAGKAAGVGDPNKPPSIAYKAGRGWHPQALAVQGHPKDRYGLIDWARIVRENLVKPKFSLAPDDDEMPPLKMDVLIAAKGDFVNDVVYPHEMHTYWLKCEICHATVGGPIFIPVKGGNDMSMVGIVQGQWCGRCHGKVAFPLTDCNRCHTSPKKASSAK